MSDQEKEFNRQMSKLRVTVEWCFGKILQNFAMLDYKKNMRVFQNPVAVLYFCAALFTNCHTCLYGSETSFFFDVQPPLLEDYLNFDMLYI